MGEHIRPGTSITDYTPDDDANTFYIYEHESLAEIIDRARSKWGEDIKFDDIKIEAEYIHTHCLYYDKYDPGDYTNFLRISKIK